LLAGGGLSTRLVGAVTIAVAAWIVTRFVDLLGEERGALLAA